MSRCRNPICRRVGASLLIKSHSEQAGKMERKKTSAFINTPLPSVKVRSTDHGAIYLSSGLSLPTVSTSLPHLFDATAAKFPDRTFVRDKKTLNGQWRALSYAEAKRASDGMAQWLIDRDVGFGSCVAYLSGPSIEHAIAAIGIQKAGAAIAPISVAYSTLTTDYTKLRECITRSGARYAIVEETGQFEGVIEALSSTGIELIGVRSMKESRLISFSELVETVPTDKVSQRLSEVRPSTVARIMHTSGSTGSPKAVPQTHTNLTLTVAQNEAVGLANFGGEAPQILEAMPFSHIMAGNFNFNNIIRTGGTINIDDGKPTPQLFHHTVANLKEISPHYFITVPLGLEMLCDAMETDENLRDGFFCNLQFLGFGGAVLADSVKERLMVLARAARGDDVPILSFYGATEYLFGTLKYWKGGPTDVIGLPLPGAELKLKPTEFDGRYELWFKSASLMSESGYLGDSNASAGLFDNEGFYRTGDTVGFSDAAKPERGLVFKGRIAEDFKLSSGTFVLVKSLREDLLACLQGLICEVVFCGANENWIGVLLWAKDPSLAQSTAFVDQVSSKLYEFNEIQPGSSRRIGTAQIMTEPLSFDDGELTDKGSVSANTVRYRRSEHVRTLFEPSKNAERLDFLADTNTSS